MTNSAEAIIEPIPISMVAGRYMIFDIDVVTYLRRTYHICGVLVGGIPQAPQQNIFNGLPLQLIPEEVKLLLGKEAAYIVDDNEWHTNHFNSTLQGADRQKYKDSLRAEGLKVAKAHDVSARKRAEVALAKKATMGAKKSARTPRNVENDHASTVSDVGTSNNSIDDGSSIGDGRSDCSLFDGERPASPLSPRSIPPALRAGHTWAVTPSTTYSASSLPQNPPASPVPEVPSSYPLFAHLHTRNYFIMPGLRFGCHYNIYPGDPLRFHSHFAATGYGWDEKISMIDVIGGGRLGTAVKKGFLIGGEDTDSEAKGDNVRAFTIEWAAM
jgi:tRNA-splicing endonuclease subunit Sen34